MPSLLRNLRKSKTIVVIFKGIDIDQTLVEENLPVL